MRILTVPSDKGASAGLRVSSGRRAGMVAGADSHR